MQTIQNQTLAALADTSPKSVGYQQQSSFLDERAALLSPTPDPLLTSKDDRGKPFALDNDIIGIFH